MRTLVQKLIQAGFTLQEAELFVFIQENSGCAMSAVCKELPWSKSTLYRAFDVLKEQGFISIDSSNWKQSLRTEPLLKLIKQLENKKRRDMHLIQYFKALENNQQWNPYETGDHIEVLNEQETYEKYIDLSQMKWDSMLAFGNWEDLNNETRNIVPLEKQFVRNRLKHGGKAFVAVTKGGPNTSEIIDYNDQLDTKEDRISKKAILPLKKPFWVNAFEGNNYVQLWNVDEQKNITSTVMNSAPVSEFYKHFIYSNLV